VMSRSLVRNSVGKNPVTLKASMAEDECDPWVILMAYMPLGHGFSSHKSKLGQLKS